MIYDLSSVTKKTFDPIPSDRYNFTIEAARVKPHVKNGVEGEEIELTLRITTECEFKNRKVWDHIYLPNALWRAKQILEAGHSTVNGQIEGQILADALVGLEVSAYLESGKTTNGNPKVDIKDYVAVVEDTNFDFSKLQ